MKKQETLRGRNSFRDVLAAGARIDGTLLRCAYRLREPGSAPLRVGFHVSARKHNAVRRNRLKRLLREAFSNAEAPVRDSVYRAQRGVSIVVMFRGSREVPVERLKLHHLQPDVERFCKAIAASV